MRRSWEVLKPGRILVSTVLPPPSSAAESGWRGEMVMVQPNAAQLQEIAKLLNAGEIRIVVEQVLPLNQIRQALALIQRE